MKNIMLIFLGDLKAIRKNVIAVIIIMGLSVIPSLYAWLNIAASWDPYENTGNIKVAVANDDDGYSGELINVKLNVGDMVTNELRKNTKMNWVFTDRKQAMEGVRSGEYYAAIVIPNTFSDDMLSLLDENVKHTNIMYYVNEKRNAIAPKVTDKGAAAVKQNVDEGFMATLVDVNLGLLESVSRDSGGQKTKDILQTLRARLQNLDATLDSTASSVSALSRMTSSLASVLQHTAGFLGNAAELTDGTATSLKKSKKQISLLGATVEKSTDGLQELIRQLLAVYDQIDQTIDQSFSTIDSDMAAAQKNLEGLNEEVARILKAYKELRADLQTVEDSLPEGTGSDSVRTQLNKMLGQMDASIAQMESLQKNLAAASDASVDTVKQLKDYKSSLKQDVADARKTLKAMNTDYEKKWKTSMRSLVKSMQKSAGSISTLLKGMGELSQNISGLTGDSVSDLQTMSSLLTDTGDLLKESDTRLDKAIKLLARASKDGNLDLLKKVMKNDAVSISSFLAAPVELNKNVVYPVENYGSAMTPFYSVLAMWVGAVILCAMLKTGLTGKRRRTLERVASARAARKGEGTATLFFGAIAQANGSELSSRIRHYEAYFGRYILFALIGLAQALLICTGDLFYLGVQCQHPFLFIVTGMVISLVFVNITYTLTLAFGDIGKAIAIILMVLQVAGSGGTFPVEMMPSAFQIAYKFEPFVYGMNAMRECIAGFYGNDYWIYMSKLLMFLIPSLFLGLVLRNPVIRLNHWIESKLESTKLM